MISTGSVRDDDLAVALVASKALVARFPDAIRTYLRFADERYSGANLFAFLTPRARTAVHFWKTAESFRKRPWRLVAAFGLRQLEGEPAQSAGHRPDALRDPGAGRT